VFDKLFASFRLTAYDVSLHSICSTQNKVKPQIPKGMFNFLTPSQRFYFFWYFFFLLWDAVLDLDFLQLDQKGLE
jgi:hypothetical protein